ncbi:hypothetical protein [Ilumatobacter coccineus]|uniref:Glycosyltransferase n=1 Tax=Ilumatobacter coccineus (strain NBRC 103263 / KCTC 29153 / YM16-304) TaxID=1313172 RepID=A0A6C7EH89_ILUCY|nr:hypothetical protein [Ilumatobacter coccineus]BAN03336.1 hypothetical protein YM304_30220 [Ilumatobacter coccineus YM16-304]
MSERQLEDECAELIRQLGIKNILIWGYRNRHTYHFIHQGFFRAFQWLSNATGVNVEWRDDTEDFTPVGPSTLILTMMNQPRIDEKVELASDSLLWIHKSGEPVEHYSRFMDAHGRGQVLFYDEFRRHRDYDANDVYPVLKPVLARVDPPVPVIYDPNSQLHWYVPSIGQATLTWGTDLLPHEVLARRDELTDLMRLRASARKVCWVGSVWKPNYERMAAVVEECETRGMHFVQYGNFVIPEFSEALKERGLDPSRVINKRYVPLEENVDLVGAAVLAPAIQGDNQLSTDGSPSYVPCRLYKNISYGQLGVSNNPTSELLFGDLVVHGSEMGELIEASSEALGADDLEDRIVESMEVVALEHTYISRIHFLLEASLARREYCA